MIGETTSNLNSEKPLRGELIDELIFKITAFSQYGPERSRRRRAFERHSK
jgi:hypothetical protein